MSADPLVLRVAATHLYPGARAVLLSRQPAGPGRPCLAEFRDGAAAFGEIAAGDTGRARLSLRSYRTSAGTEIPAKVWEIALGEPDDGGIPCRVIGRTK